MRRKGSKIHSPQLCIVAEGRQRWREQRLKRLEETLQLIVVWADEALSAGYDTKIVLELIQSTAEEALRTG